MLRTIAEFYGYESQSRQLIEEMAELTVAINKLWRFDMDNRDYAGKKDVETHLFESACEEIADVEIMLAQIKYLLRCEEEVARQRERKISRQIKRMEGVTHEQKEIST